MSFFEKFNQFRELKDQPKDNPLEGQVDLQQPSSVLQEDKHPLLFSREESSPLGGAPESMSIRELWQQALESHREQRNQEPVEQKQEETELEETMIEPQEERNELDAITEEASEEILLETKDAFEPITSSLSDQKQDDHSYTPELSAASDPMQQDGFDGQIPPISQEEIDEEGSVQEDLAPETNQEEQTESNENQVETGYNAFDQTIDSLYEISVEDLEQEVNQTLRSVYDYFRQGGEWLGLDFPHQDVSELKHSKLGQLLDTVTQVIENHGKVHDASTQAVNLVLPFLWRGMLEEEYKVPEKWYHTNLGFLFRYIQAGAHSEPFEPIDLSTTAALLNWTEKEVVSRYPQLGGVKLDMGYVFSRKKIEEFISSRMEVPSEQITMEDLELYYFNTKQALTNLIQMKQFMNEAYDELRFIRDLLLSGTDFAQNRIKQPVKVQIEKRLGEVYYRYRQVKDLDVSEMQINSKSFVAYMLPNIFQSFDQLGDTVVNGEKLAQSIEECIQTLGDERSKLNQLTDELTKNLGQMSVDIDMVKIKQMS